MQLRKRLIAALMGVSLLPAIALAGTESGFYLGAGVGKADAGDLDDGSTNISFDGDDTGWKIFGGYNFGFIPLIDLAIEGGYVDFGKPDDNFGPNNLEIDANGFDLFGLVGVNLGPVGLFAKAGLVQWDADASVNGQDVASDDGTDPAYGIGARLKFGSLEARAEYEYFDIDNVDDVSLLSASVAWTF